MSNPDAPNAGQAAAWDGPNGETWVRMQDALDRELAQLGQAALAALAPKPGERILDIGCGCGATTLELAHVVGPGGEALGVDLSQAMLAVGRRRAAEAGLAQARFVQADAQVFAPAPAGYDAAYSRFGVMLFADPVAAFANIARALAPGGRVAFVAWRTPRENPAMSLPMAAAGHLFPPMPPTDPLAPGPFAFADRDRVRRVLADAGFTGVEVERFDCKTVAGDLEESLDLYTQIGPLGRALREAPEKTQAARAAVRAAIEPFDTPTGVQFDAAAWIVTAART